MTRRFIMAIDYEIKKKARLALARKDFYYYCQLKTPKFYKEDRSYLKEFCSSLQTFMNSDNKVLIVNMPP